MIKEEGGEAEGKVRRHTLDTQVQCVRLYITYALKVHENKEKKQKFISNAAMEGGLPAGDRCMGHHRSQRRNHPAAGIESNQGKKEARKTRREEKCLKFT